VSSIFSFTSLSSLLIDSQNLDALQHREIGEGYSKANLTCGHHSIR